MRQRRRTSAQIRALIVDAARVLFIEQGFDDTTTRQIAEKANVHEHLIFSNFGSKADLFQVAVTEPLAATVTTSIDSWVGDSTGSNAAERIEELVDALYDLGRTNRPMLLWALANSRHGGPGRGLLEQVATSLRHLTDVDTAQYPDIDKDALASTAAAMAFGAALLDDMLYPPSAHRPSKERMMAEMRKVLSARMESATGRE
jgi:AcrR family transcriptional regulator